MWGCSDVEMVQLVRRLVYDVMTQQAKAARLVERCVDFVDESDAVVVHELTRHSDDDVTRINNAQARQHSATYTADSDHLQSILLLTDIGV